MCLQIIGAGTILNAGIKRMSHGHEEPFCRAQWLRSTDPFLPALTGQIARCLQGCFKISKGGLIIGNQIFQPASQPAGPSASSVFGPANPVPQFGAFLRAEIQGKGTVSCIKHVMPLIKDIAGWPPPVAIGIAGRCIGRIDHDQRVIADHDVSALRPAHRLFHKTAIVMGTRAVNTFAAPVGQSDSLWPANQIRQPRREGGTCQISVASRPCPACHQAQCRTTARGTAQTAQRLFKIEKTQIVFAALANHHFAGPFCRIGIQAGQFRCHLMLQRTGVG